MYPYILQTQNEPVFPVFGSAIKKIVFAGLSKGDSFLETVSDEEIKNQEQFNAKIFSRADTHSTAVVSGYLENRERFFKVLDCKQMVEEERFFHLGLDITLPKNTVIFAPLAAEVVISGYESGNGNYGGRMVLKHQIAGNIFYSLYGHLNPASLLPVGSMVSAGEKIAELGDFEENGGYFHHLHLQVITQAGFDSGFVSKGYCTAQQLVDIKNYCPDPTFLFRF